MKKESQGGKKQSQERKEVKEGCEEKIKNSIFCCRHFYRFFLLIDLSLLSSAPLLFSLLSISLISSLNFFHLLSSSFFFLLFSLHSFYFLSSSSLPFIPLPFSSILLSPLIFPSIRLSFFLLILSIRAVSVLGARAVGYRDQNSYHSRRRGCRVCGRQGGK